MHRAKRMTSFRKDSSPAWAWTGLKRTRRSSCSTMMTDLCLWLEEEHLKWHVAWSWRWGDRLPQSLWGILLVYCAMQLGHAVVPVWWWELWRVCGSVRSVVRCGAVYLKGRDRRESKGCNRGHSSQVIEISWSIMKWTISCKKGLGTVTEFDDLKNLMSLIICLTTW